MKRTRILVAIGLVLAALTLLFPQTRYPVRTETREAGQLVGVKQSTAVTFAMPLWKALPEQKRNTGNPLTDTTIMWFPTIVRALVIAVLFGPIALYATRTSPPPSDPT